MKSEYISAWIVMSLTPGVLGAQDPRTAKEIQATTKVIRKTDEERLVSSRGRDVQHKTHRQWTILEEDRKGFLVVLHAWTSIGEKGLVRECTHPLNPDIVVRDAQRKDDKIAIEGQCKITPGILRLIPGKPKIQRKRFAHRTEEQSKCEIRCKVRVSYPDLRRWVQKGGAKLEISGVGKEKLVAELPAFWIEGFLSGARDLAKDRVRTLQSQLPSLQEAAKDAPTLRRKLKVLRGKSLKGGEAERRRYFEARTEFRLHEKAEQRVVDALQEILWRSEVDRFDAERAETPDVDLIRALTQRIKDTRDQLQHVRESGHLPRDSR